MKILVVTPLVTPQIGGPALYATELSKVFGQEGHEVRIVSFSRGLPSGVRHAVCFLRVLFIGRTCDAVLVLDHFSVGFPAHVACVMLRKPLFVRVGGDFLWEHYVNRKRTRLPLPRFYSESPHLSVKEWCIRWAMRRVLQTATRVIFSTEWQRDIFLSPYGIPRDHSEVIENYFPAAESVHTRTGEIIWAGRMVYAKNLESLVRGFCRVRCLEDMKLLLIGDGPERGAVSRLINDLGVSKRVIMVPPMWESELAEKIAMSAALVLPSLTEVSSNTLARAVSAGTPFLTTKYIGWPEEGAEGVLVDPASESDIERGLGELCESNSQTRVGEEPRRRERARSWEEVARDFISIFSQTR